MEHTFKSLMRRLSQAGFKKEFVRTAILPDWWDEDCAEDPSLLQDIEIRVARFLGLSLSVVKDVSSALVPPAYPHAQLRQVRDIDHDRLGPAIHSALRIARSVARNLRDSVPGRARVPPSDGLSWREEISASGAAPTLDELLSDLWGRGIPVVPVDLLPAPSFQGIACIVDDRPIIILGHKHDEPGRVAFLVGHEVGHLAAGDCKPDQPVVDEEGQVRDDSPIERRADRYAIRLLAGGDSIPEIEPTDFKQLANRAAKLELETGADAGFIIFAWASESGDYAKATMAVKALYRGKGARLRLQQHFAKHVDVAGASESDHALLRCVRSQSQQYENIA